MGESGRENEAAGGKKLILLSPGETPPPFEAPFVDVTKYVAFLGAWLRYGPATHPRARLQFHERKTFPQSGALLLHRRRWARRCRCVLLHCAGALGGPNELAGKRRDVRRRGFSRSRYYLERPLHRGAVPCAGRV